MNDFVGSKVALFLGEKLVVFLRDNKPEIPNPNMWDFFGGGREGVETPLECAIREIEEELGIQLEASDFIWEQAHPALRNPEETAYFFVANLTPAHVDQFNFQEGQRWALMEPQEFLEREDAVEGMQERLRNYLANQ